MPPPYIPFMFAVVAISISLSILECPPFSGILLIMFNIGTPTISTASLRITNSPGVKIVFTVSVVPGITLLSQSEESHQSGYL